MNLSNKDTDKPNEFRVDMKKSKRGAEKKRTKNKIELEKAARDKKQRKLDFR